MPTASLVRKSGFTAIGQDKHMNFRSSLDARIVWLVAQAGMDSVHCGMSELSIAEVAKSK
jgi:hypothetical protein